MPAPAQQAETILLFDVPWSTYEGILSALPEHPFRHTYDRGTLELFSPLVYGVSWRSYEMILTAFGDRRFRHTYAEGTLEIMSPSQEHEWLKEFIGRLVEMAALELDIPIKSVGSTTRRHPQLLRGLEPDLSYYVQHESEVRGRGPLDLDRSPPPDLVVEVDITHKVIDRLDAYATLDVPEVWRYRDGSIRFFQLRENRRYLEVPRSLAFPKVSSAAVSRALQMLDDTDENAVVREFVGWLSEPSSEVD